MFGTPSQSSIGTLAVARTWPQPARTTGSSSRPESWNALRGPEPSCGTVDQSGRKAPIAHAGGTARSTFESKQQQWADNPQGADDGRT